MRTARFCPAMLLLILGCFAAVQAQPAKPVHSGERPAEETLKSLVTSIEAQDALIKELNDKIKAAATAEQRKPLSDQITAASDRLSSLKRDLTSIAACIPYDELAGMRAEDVSLQRELNDLLMPLLSSIKEATQQPRAIEALNTSIETQQVRLARIQDGLDNLKIYAPTYDDAAVKKRLAEIQKDLDQQKGDVETRIHILEHQRDDLKSRRKSFFASSTDVFRKFFRTRGVNLLLAVLVFILIFVGSRLLHQRFNRFSPLHRPGRRSFYTRLADVSYYALTSLGAVLCSLLVLYVRGDWLLLSLAILFLAAIALAAKNGLPRFYEQTRLLLNLGEVREGERVVIAHVPWRVDSLSLYSVLTNPWLTGGSIRMPLRQITTLISRPFDASEPWFPSKEGDWVMLDDGVWGRVVLQSPEQVQLVLLGGARKTYGVESFLQQNPKNLSTGFRVTATLGLDYEHQSKATDEIPKLMQDSIHRGLLEVMDREHVQNLNVEFAVAGASSLDLYLCADFTGDVAAKHDHLHRLLQKLAVEACEANGWRIPFPQMAVHVTGPSPTPPPG